MSFADFDARAYERGYDDAFDLALAQAGLVSADAVKKITCAFAIQELISAALRAGDYTYEWLREVMPMVDEVYDLGPLVGPGA